MSALTIGSEIPEQIRTPEAVDLFMFSASAWLLHRIHYDVPFTTEVDGHPGLLVHGPLQGTYMIQTAQAGLGDSARLRSITYRHSAPAYLGDTLVCGGTVTEIDGDDVTVEIWARKDGDTVTTTGTAVFSVTGG